MKTKLFNNMGLKILSVVAATLLWLVVMNVNDAVTSKQFRNIKVNTINMEAITDQGQTVRVEDGTDTVDLTVYARRTVLDKLKASDFTATADMQKDLSYGSMVKIEVAYNGNYAIDKIKQSRENVLVSIEEEVTEQFKVTVVDTNNGKLSDGLVVGSMVPEQSLVEITGPASVVEKIKRVEAHINTAGITGTQIRTCNLKLMNSDGDEIDGTYLQYIGKDSEFEVTISTLNTKLVGISFDVSEAAPEGYGLTAIAYKPETVTIAGQKSQISGIYNLDIPASALNPEGLTGKVEQTVDISQYLPDGITIPEDDEREIVVTMEITAHDMENYTFTADQIEYEEVPEGMELDLSGDTTLEISVSGLASELETLTTDQIKLTVDLSGISKTGTYTVPVNVELPDGFTCVGEPNLDVRLIKSAILS
jgi:YbbR domain-containing protein